MAFSGAAVVNSDHSPEVARWTFGRSAPAQGRDSTALDTTLNKADTAFTVAVVLVTGVATLFCLGALVWAIVMWATM